MHAAHYLRHLSVPALIVASIALSGAAIEGSASSLLIGLCLIVAAFVMAWQRSLKRPSNAALLAGGSFLMLYLLSAHADFTRYALFGAAVEWGTVASVVLFVLAYLAGSIKSQQASVSFLWGIEICGVGVAAAATLALFGFIPAGLLAASWPQLAVLSCGAALVAAQRADTESTALRHLHFAAAAVSLAVFIAGFLPEIGFALVVAVFVAVWGSAHRNDSYSKVTIAVAIVIILVLAAGLRSPLMSFAAEDGRPALHDTMLVAGAVAVASEKDALIGTGPHSFPFTWNAYRPIDANSSPYWMQTPKFPFSTLIAIAIEAGFLGMISFLLYALFPIMVLGGAISRFRGADDERVAVALVALFCIASACVSSLGTPLMIVVAYASGLCARSDEYAELRSRWVYLAAAACCVLGLMFSWTAVRQLQAHSTDARGLALLNANQPREAVPLFEAAASQWETAEYDQDAAEAYKDVVITDISTHATDATEADRGKASQYAGRMKALGISDFSRWLYLGTFNLDMQRAGVAGSAAAAQAALDTAATLSPTRPDVPYTQALLALTQGNISGAAAYLDAALALKPDYADARALQERVLQSP